tara:strand:+ start:791 stop:907 length:117 start_codon:yes stop_codon:yes gene_type:complete
MDTNKKYFESLYDVFFDLVETGKDMFVTKDKLYPLILN